MPEMSTYLMSPRTRLTLKFFILLATVLETDLGFDTNIERVRETEFNLQFTIEGRHIALSKTTVLTLVPMHIPAWGSLDVQVVEQGMEEVRVIIGLLG